MNANAKQIQGSHYQTSILDGCAVKYLSRWRKKGGVDDLRKAVHFIEKLIEVEIANEKS